MVPLILDLDHCCDFDLNLVDEKIYIIAMMQSNSSLLNHSH